MADIAFTAWTDEVLKSIKGIDNAAYAALLEDQIRDTVRMFCKGTALWWADLARITVVAGQRLYPLTPLLPPGPASAEIAFIDNVKFKEDGEPDTQFRNLDPLREWLEDQAEDYGDWEFRESDNPTHFDLRELDNEILLYPIPDTGSTDGLLVRTILMPDHDATECPDFFYRHYKEEIGIGIVASLMQLTNKPWSNEELGIIKQKEFDSYITKALHRKQSGFTRRATKVNFPHFGGSRADSWVF